MSNSIQIVMNEMKKNMGKNVTVELKRQTKDGALIPASDDHVDALNLQSQLSSVAHVVQHMTYEERTEWAIGTKKYANELYKNEMYKEAMAKYIECLTASEFGNTVKKSDIISPKDTKYDTNNRNSSKSSSNPESISPLNSNITDLSTSSSSMLNTTTTTISSTTTSADINNINEVVIPVLNNLTACAMKIYEYSKAIMFCKQLLTIQPGNYKSLCRLSLCYIHIGEYQSALDILDKIDIEQGLDMEVEVVETIDIIESEGNIEDDLLIGMKQNESISDLNNTNNSPNNINNINTTIDLEFPMDSSTNKDKNVSETISNSMKTTRENRNQYIKCLQYKAKLGLQKEKKNLKRQANAYRKILTKSNDRTKNDDVNAHSVIKQNHIVEANALNCAISDIISKKVLDSTDSIIEIPSNSTSTPVVKKKKESSVMDLVFILCWLAGVFIMSMLIIRFIMYIY